MPFINAGTFQVRRNVSGKVKTLEEASCAQLEAKDRAYGQLVLSLQSKEREIELANQRVGWGLSS